MSPNELECLRNASNHLEICDIHMNHGNCEGRGCRDEREQTRRATVLVGGHYLCETCADERDRGKSATLIEPRIRVDELKNTQTKKCDSQCGRDGVIQFRKFTFCEQCAAEILGSDGPFPRLQLEDVTPLPDCRECGERAGAIEHKQQRYCSSCFEMLKEWEAQDEEEL